MKKVYDILSQKVSTQVMYEYSTSFYLSTFCYQNETDKPSFHYMALYV